ncbi:MAG: hypothetical protein E7369_05455 [Clostridiales bacterium]|nr:hypothetical protein [Clostridiales bacterium]
MRTYPVITKTKTQNKVYDITDFSLLTRYSENVFDGTGLKDAGLYKEDVVRITGRTVLKVYTVADRVFVYCDDKKVYAVKDKSLEEFCLSTFDNAPEIFSLILRGKPSVAVVYNGFGVIVGDTHAIAKFPEGNGYLVYNDTVFCHSKNTVNFGGRYDYSGHTVTLTPTGFICVKGLGDIVKLLRRDDGVLVVCERGFALISAEFDRSSYKLKYFDKVISGIDYNSINSVGNVVYFTADGKLFSFYKETLRHIPTLLDEVDYTVTGEAYAMDKYYILPVKSINPTTFIYDTQTEKSTFLPFDCGKVANEINRLSFNGRRFDSFWQSKPTDFGIALEKTVYKVQVKANTHVIVRIRGDNGLTKTLSIGDGRAKSLNISSTDFTIEILSPLPKTAVESIKIYYRI